MAFSAQQRLPLKGSEIHVQLFRHLNEELRARWNRHTDTRAHGHTHTHTRTQTHTDTHTTYQRLAVFISLASACASVCALNTFYSRYLVFIFVISIPSKRIKLDYLSVNNAVIVLYVGIVQNSCCAYNNYTKSSLIRDTYSSWQ